MMPTDEEGHQHQICNHFSKIHKLPFIPPGEYLSHSTILKIQEQPFFIPVTDFKSSIQDTSVSTPSQFNFYRKRVMGSKEPQMQRKALIMPEEATAKGMLAVC